MREVVRDLDIPERHFDIFDVLAVLCGTFDLALVLVQQRQRVDQGEVLLVVTP